MTRKIAVISGITGQDGAYLSKLLIDHNYQVVGLTRSYSNINKNNLKYVDVLDKVIIEECDLLDFSSIIKILLKYKPLEFYNLAAQSSVGLSFEQPIGTINYNTSTVLNILESIRLLALDTKFYQASSSEMFGSVSTLPINSSTPLHPLSPYAISKATAYWTVINYRESYGIYAVNGVLFNHESYLRSPNFFIKKVLKSSLDIKAGVQDVLKVGNVNIKRDFGYAPDYVRAMWLSLQTSKPGDYFICSGESVYLKDIIHYVFDYLNIPFDRLVEDPSLFRPTDIEDIYGDNSKAKKDLGWEYDKTFYEVLNLLIDEESANYKK
ncbi:GDP-mannose 4,6-dehydratase [Hufsiella ginkgonis]|uniref:GDP-mannose 4,6-dehydratase n=1 Tax=Hufsiella ginkgonis TaxID=2695274 RepID=A0A7K1Y2S5_9SPHI|nr:GDP-mannose 4,6-dehydratase [Hufsiella ginkgonis]MXV17388.1 NAD-dependent epimerase/dehydratase family protein [Hufsiella ginkgonis]